MNERLQQVFREVFDDPALVITSEMTAQDVDGWDSLAHVTLIMAIEDEFHVRFTTNEIAALKRVGDLQALLQARTGQAG